MRVAQTKMNCINQVSKKQLVIFLNNGFSAEKKIYREHLLTMLQTEILTAVEKIF